MPDVLIMRHAEAAPGYPDQARRLTPHGEQEVKKMARWLTERVADGSVTAPDWVIGAPVVGTDCC